MVFGTADIYNSLNVMHSDEVLNEIPHSVFIVDVHIGNAFERHTDTYDRKPLFLGCPAAVFGKFGVI